MIAVIIVLISLSLLCCNDGCTGLSLVNLNNNKLYILDNQQQNLPDLLINQQSYTSYLLFQWDVTSADVKSKLYYTSTITSSEASIMLAPMFVTASYNFSSVSKPIFAIIYACVSSSSSTTIRWTIEVLSGKPSVQSLAYQFSWKQLCISPDSSLQVSWSGQDLIHNGVPQFNTNTIISSNSIELKISESGAAKETAQLAMISTFLEPPVASAMSLSPSTLELTRTTTASANIAKTCNLVTKTTIFPIMMTITTTNPVSFYFEVACLAYDIVIPILITLLPIPTLAILYLFNRIHYKYILREYHKRQHLNSPGLFFKM